MNQPKRGPMDPLKLLEKQAKTWETYARNWCTGTRRSHVSTQEAWAKARALRAQIVKLKGQNTKG